MSRFLISALAGRLPIMSLCLLSAAAVARPAIEPLARAPMWLKLGHYHTSLMSPSGYTSYVNDSAFFLSENGKHDPQAELTATVQLFSQEQPSDGKACHFLARYQWLTGQGHTFPSLSCPEYDHWRQQLQAHSVTLVFPVAYMNNPSSMFGHTFLRFDPENIAEDSPWLSWEVNFGATPAEKDYESITHIWKGLAGGYPGKFSMTPYYRKLQEYNRQENRDIWEYQLKLSPEQTAFISLHIWELQDIYFDYYFIDENCSFRLLELLELASPDLDLTSRFSAIAIPVDTVRAVLDAGLVQNIYYRPSDVTLLRHYLAPLNPQEQALVYEMTQDPRLTESEAIAHLPAQRQARMIQSAYKYLRYEANKRARPSSTKTAESSLALLRGLNRLPPHHTPPRQHRKNRNRGMAPQCLQQAQVTTGTLVIMLIFRDVLSITTCWIIAQASFQAPRSPLSICISEATSTITGVLSSSISSQSAHSIHGPGSSSHCHGKCNQGLNVSQAPMARNTWQPILTAERASPCQ